MRVDSEVPVYGEGHQEWLLDLPREGTFADVAKQIPNAKEFQLRPDNGGTEQMAIPMDLSNYDLRLYLADGYHVFAEVHPVDFSFVVAGGAVQTVHVAPSTTIADLLQRHCGDAAAVDEAANFVFLAASVELVQGLGMGTRASPLLLKWSGSPGTGRPSVWRRLSKHASFDSLGRRLSSVASTLSGLRPFSQPPEPQPPESPTGGA